MGAGRQRQIFHLLVHTSRGHSGQAGQAGVEGQALRPGRQGPKCLHCLWLHPMHLSRGWLGGRAAGACTDTSSRTRWAGPSRGPCDVLAWGVGLATDLSPQPSSNPGLELHLLTQKICLG